MLIQSRKNSRHRPWPRCRILLAAGLVALGGMFVFQAPIRTAVRQALLDLGYRGGTRKVSHIATGKMISEIPRAAINWIGSLGNEAPLLALDIKFKHLSFLRARKAEAMATGVLVQKANDLRPAVLRLKDRSVRVRVRLKGDIVDRQFDEDSWSLRVHVRGGDHLFGMRRFNLHPAMARDYHAEPLFLDHVRHVGVLAPRYMFVRVNLNGDDLGIMAIEEHFSKELLESQDRREGVILKFDDSRFFAFKDSNDRFDSPFNSYLHANVVPFRRSRIEGNPVLADNLRVATGLYRAFAQGSLAPSQVFDAKTMGRFLAVVQTWGAWHAAMWHNIRFYFNPITSRLEPIAYDAELFSADGITPEALHARLLDDARIRAHYQTTLEAIAAGDAAFLPAKQLADRQEDYLEVLHLFWPFLKPVDIAGLAATARASLDCDPAENVHCNPQIRGRQPRRQFPPERLMARDLILANVVSDGAERYLELRNLVPFPVAVYPHGNSKGTSSTGAPLAVLAPTPLDALPESICIPVPAGKPAERVLVSAVGHGRSHWVWPMPYFPPRRTVPTPAPDLNAALSQGFLEYDAAANTVTSQPGTWQVSGTISLPDGVHLVLEPGTELLFEERGALVVRGGTSFRGTADSPVSLRGRGGPAPGRWRGVAVLGSGATTEWSHVHVHGTTGVDFEDWHLTGGVTIHEGRVKLQGCRFVATTAEDALNIVRARFELVAVDVDGAASDGIDFDFGSGTVTGGTLTNVGMAGGGDGMDFSGARATVSGTRFYGVGDKALSVGERSTVYVTGVDIRDALVGAASKDCSYLNIESASMTRVRLAAVMAYIKKTEFGGAVLDAKKLTLHGVDHRSLAQRGSMVRFDGVSTESKQVDINKLYKTLMMRASPRVALLCEQQRDGCGNDPWSRQTTGGATSLCGGEEAVTQSVRSGTASRTPH